MKYRGRRRRRRRVGRRRRRRVGRRRRRRRVGRRRRDGRRLRAAQRRVQLVFLADALRARGEPLPRRADLLGVDGAVAAARGQPQASRATAQAVVHEAEDSDVVLVSTAQLEIAPPLRHEVVGQERLVSDFAGGEPVPEQGGLEPLGKGRDVRSLLRAEAGSGDERASRRERRAHDPRDRGRPEDEFRRARPRRSRGGALAEIRREFAVRRRALGSTPREEGSAVDCDRVVNAHGGKRKGLLLDARARRAWECGAVGLVTSERAFLFRST